MKQSNLHGLLILALGFFVFSLGDTLAKHLTEGLHPVQIVWARQSGLLAVAVVFLLLRGPGILRTKAPFLQITRGIFAGLSAICFVITIKFVPLADAVAVTFVAPFMVTILGAIFLHEYVSLQRWVMIGLGFLGALIIIRPGLGVFHPAIILVVIAAAFFASRQVLSRFLAATDNTATTLSYTAIASFALMSIPLPFVWKTPTSTETVLILIALALLAALGEFMIIRAFQITEAVVAAPMHYSLIIWATLLGWIVFGQLPDFWTWCGTTVIVLTGIYLMRMEFSALRSGTRRED